MTKFTPIHFLNLMIKGAVVFTLLLTGTALNGQRYTFSVQTPVDLQEDYVTFIAAFGPQYCDVESISGELIIVEDSDGDTFACTEVVNDLSGKIAIVDRTDCDFDLQVLNAQDQGAIAVIVCNFDEGLGIMLGGDLEDQVKIPSFLLRKSNCDDFRGAIAEGVTVSITRDVPEYGPAAIVWGDEPGQGDFNEGLNGWTVNNLSCGNGEPGDFQLWRWEATGNAPNGSCGPGELFSPTKCNGAMIFESDFYDSNGGECGTDSGTGECTSPQIGELISPSIDLTGSNASAFSVRFFQETRQFLSDYFVGWSTDGGVTWDSTAINISLNPGDQNPLDEIEMKVPLTGVDNTVSDLRIKFRYEADYYYWIIDDVQVIEQEANNLRVNRNFFAVPPNLAMPRTQVEPIYFLADIENIGAQTQTNVVLDMTISEVIDDDQLEQVFNTQLEYGDVPPNTLVENIPFDDTYTPEKRGLFLGRYQISGDQEDSDTTNTFQEFIFAVTDTTFAKERGATTFIPPADENWDQGAPHSAAYGNYFHIVNDKDAAGNQLFFSSVSFGLYNADEIQGSELVIAIYKWEDLNGDGNLAGGGVQPDEREFIDFASYIVQGTERPTDIINVAFPEGGGDMIPLEANTDYLVMIQYEPPASNPQQDLLMVWSDDIDYNAMAFVTDLEGKPRYAPLVGLSGDLSTETYNTFGFGREQVPVIRLHITEAANSNPRVQALRQQFLAFPNPTSGEINLRLGLEETAETARVRIFDMTGRLLLQQEYENVQKELLQFNAGNWKSGTYIIELSTEKGTGTRRIVVAK